MIYLIATKTAFDFSRTYSQRCRTRLVWYTNVLQGGRSLVDKFVFMVYKIRFGDIHRGPVGVSVVQPLVTVFSGDL